MVLMFSTVILGRMGVQVVMVSTSLLLNDANLGSVSISLFFKWSLTYIVFICDY